LLFFSLDLFRQCCIFVVFLIGPVNTVGTGPMRKTTKIQHCRNRSNEKNNKNTTLSEQVVVLLFFSLDLFRQCCIFVDFHCILSFYTVFT
jgi:hypothetical protein